MRKIIAFIFSVIGFAIVFSACGGESYADKLKKEKKAIESFIDKKGFKTRSTYPVDGKFQENEYYKDSDTGIYLRIINHGDQTQKPSKEKKTEVYVRYYDLAPLIVAPDSAFTNDILGARPIVFNFGVPSTYLSNSQGTLEYSYLSPACVKPLEDYGLGNGAEISLIVPFKQGSVMQQNSYEPLYFGRLKYTFIPDEN